MKFRMASARCCCGAIGPTSCDPINGYFDLFDSFTFVAPQFPLLPGRWHVTKQEGASIAASGGKLRIDHASIPIGVARKTIVERCSIWDTFEHGGVWPTTSGIQLRLNYQWSNGSQSLDGQLYESLGAYPQVASIFYDMLDGTIRRRTSVSAKLSYVTGVGWRHRFEFVDVSSTPIVAVVASTAVFSTSRFLPVNSTFTHSVVMSVAPLPSQIWFAQVNLNGSSLMTYPATTMTKPANGFGEATYVTGFDVGDACEWLEADEWKYL